MKRTHTFIAFLLAVAMVFASAIPAWADPSAADAQAAQKRAEEARKKSADAQAGAAELEEEVKDLDAAVALSQQSLSDLQPKIDEATKRVDDLKTKLEQTQKEYAKQQVVLANCLDTVYRQGGSDMLLQLVLTSDDLSQLITRVSYANRITENANDAANQLAKTKTVLDRTHKESQTTQENLLALKRRYENIVETQNKQMVDKQAKLAKMYTDARSYAQIANIEEQSAAQILEELKSYRGSGVYGNGTMTWPVPSSRRITSSFGDTSNRSKPHNAIDIGAPSGTPVVAAGDGRIIKAAYGYNGGYGNTIQIDHGNGIVTAYHHLKDGSFKIGTGEVVKAGQQIAGVGSTGFSTGPHLDFQVIINGDYKNPLDYVK